MPRYTPAQRRALSTIAEFRDEFREPAPPPADPTLPLAERSRANLERIARDLEPAAPTEPLPPRRPVCARRVAEVVDAVAAYYRVPAEAVRSGSRRYQHARPRHVAAYLLRERFGLSLPAVGRHLGGRNHSTIFSSLRWVRRTAEADPAFAAVVAAMLGRKGRAA